MGKKEIQIVQTDHLLFQGVPIDGNMNTFVYKMEQKGYTIECEACNVCKMEGKFANQDVEILIGSTPLTDVACKVFVNMEEPYWDTAKTTYYKFKLLLSKKYGNIIEEVEQFKEPYYDGDGYEFLAIRNGCCVFSTRFKALNGIITVMINSNEDFDGVIIGYEDDKNCMIYDIEENQIAYNDI